MLKHKYYVTSILDLDYSYYEAFTAFKNTGESDSSKNYILEYDSESEYWKIYEIL